MQTLQRNSTCVKSDIPMTYQAMKRVKVTLQISLKLLTGITVLVRI